MNIVSIAMVFMTGLIVGWMMSSSTTADKPSASIDARELEIILRAYHTSQEEIAHRGSESSDAFEAVLAQHIKSEGRQ